MLAFSYVSLSPLIPATCCYTTSYTSTHTRPFLCFLRTHAGYCSVIYPISGLILLDTLAVSRRAEAERSRAEQSGAERSSGSGWCFLPGTNAGYK